MRSGTYFWIAIGMIATMFVGFVFTYFGPVARGTYPEVSPLVHVHGITFFAWYMLLAAQAALVRAREVKLHRTLGLATIVFGALVIVVGFVVSVVRVDDGVGPNADPFWALMALPIFAIWLRSPASTSPQSCIDTDPPSTSGTCCSQAPRRCPLRPSASSGSRSGTRRRST